MTPSALAERLFASYEQQKADRVHASNCRHAVVSAELRTIVDGSDGLLAIEEIGRSLEGRSISMVSCGTGQRHILLWSQMHGDESTATLALLDVFQFLARRSTAEQWVGEMLERTMIHAIPLLNPDGAERMQRHTAVHIDMNRDAQALATPEARILRDAQRQLSPFFGFNLHDQALSSVGSTARVAALALLAPALDEEKSQPPVRLRAMKIGALIVHALAPFVGGHITTYDDDFEPRAFGDGMQSWGTSTLLIESGHWPGDPGKEFVRKLNYVALLTSLSALGSGLFEQADLAEYSGLPRNGKRVFDYIIRDVQLIHSGGWTHKVDIGVIVDPADNRTGPGPRDGAASPRVTIKEIGDLSTHAGLETINAHERTLNSPVLAIDQVLPLAELLDQLQVR